MWDGKAMFVNEEELMKIGANRKIPNVIEYMKKKCLEHCTRCLLQDVIEAWWMKRKEEITNEGWIMEKGLWEYDETNRLAKNRTRWRTRAVIAPALMAEYYELI